MNIRQFKDTDKKAVINLWQACGLTRPWNDPAKDIERKQRMQPELFLIGELDGNVIASAMVGYDGHRGSVYYLAVSPGQQQLGYGKILMARIEEILTSLGCPKLNILIRTSNTGVMDFYAGLGYAADDAVSISKRLIPDA